MTVSAVNQNDGSTRLNTIIKSTAAGTVAGYAMKYIWPITKQEDTTINRRNILKLSRKATNESKVSEFKNAGVKTKAQDCFVKMIESGDKEAFKPESIKRKVAALGGENSADAKEFMGIVRNVDSAAAQMAKRMAVSNKIYLKYIRPAVPFLVAGAGIGFFTGFTHNVLKTDYYA